MKPLPRTLQPAASVTLALLAAGTLTAQGAIEQVQSLGTIFSASGTQHKPQSKVWRHGGHWWCVLDDAQAVSHVYRLDGTSWSQRMQLGSDQHGRTADVVVDGNYVHVLLHDSGDAHASVWSLSFDPAAKDYSPWSVAATPQTVILGESAETATMALDSMDRLWIAHDAGASPYTTATNNTVHVHYSLPPYTSWLQSGNGTLANNLTPDDICAIAALPTGHIGVLWSNQATDRFGFRARSDASPVNAAWGPVETPMDSPTQPFDADDHINLAVASDGTLYAAVKTSLDTLGLPVIGLLVRRPNGTWDPAYDVFLATQPNPYDNPTRPSVVLDEASGKVTVLYCGIRGPAGRSIMFQQACANDISFDQAREQTLMSEAGGLCDATSATESIDGETVILASGYGTPLATYGAIARIAGAPRGFYRFDEASGMIAQDLSGEGNTATIQGGATRVAGVTDLALSCDGVDDFALVPDSDTLDLTCRITLAAWVRPNAFANQTLVKKAVSGVADGYELGLDHDGRAFVRFNEASAGDSHRLDAVTSYPIDGGWMHLAATYDGAAIRIHVDGVEEASLPAVIAIGENAGPLSIGAESDGFGFQWPLNGDIDDVEVIGRALTPHEIACRARALTAGAVGRYSFEGTSSTTVIDSSGANNDGAIAGAPQRVPGVHGQAMEFDGSIDHVLIADAPSLAPTCRLTLAAWVRPEAIGTQSLIKKSVDNVADGYELALSAAGFPFVRLNALHSLDEYRLDGTAAYPTDGATWMHLAATFDGATLRLYTDGVEVANMPAPIDIRGSSMPLTIAAQSDGSVLRFPFQGAMDEIEVHDRALTWGEIACRAFGPGSFEFVAAGCQNSTGMTATLAPTGTMPAIGASSGIELSQSPANTAAFMFLGFARVNPPIGQSLAYLGAPGCIVHPSPVSVFLGIVGPTGTSNWTVDIPFAPAYLGLRLFTQALVVDPGPPPPNAAGFVLSDSFQLVFGCGQ